VHGTNVKITFMNQFFNKHFQFTRSCNDSAFLLHPSLTHYYAVILYVTLQGAAVTVCSIRCNIKQTNSAFCPHENFVCFTLLSEEPG